VHTQDQSDLCNALAVHNREDGEEIFDPAQAAKVLGRFQVVLHFFTVSGRDGKTYAAHRAFLHSEMGISLGGISPMCGDSSIHLRKIFFLKSIDPMFAL
jgi:hypothetical protein